MGIYDELQKISTVSPTPSQPGNSGPEQPTENVDNEPVQSRESQLRKSKQRQPIKETNQGTKESLQTSKHASLQAYMQAILEEKAAYAVTFRYPPKLLEKLDDLIHFARTNNKTKLTKNSLAVAALSFLIWEFETREENSSLYKILIEKAK